MASTYLEEQCSEEPNMEEIRSKLQRYRDAKQRRKLRSGNQAGPAIRRIEQDDPASYSEMSEITCRLDKLESNVTSLESNMTHQNAKINKMQKSINALTEMVSELYELSKVPGNESESVQSRELNAEESD